MSNFHIHIEEPKEIIPRLGKREKHWKVGRSAYELSTAWMGAKGIPATVRRVLAQEPQWQAVELLEGIFERETAMPGRGWLSQTDLLALVRLPDGNAILGVEGKVDESFGPLVGAWLRPARKDEPVQDAADPEASETNRMTRLRGLCRILEIDPVAAEPLYYQLLHRTCAVLLEAKRFGYARAVMLVHSFDARATSDRAIARRPASWSLPDSPTPLERPSAVPKRYRPPSSATACNCSSPGFPTSRPPRPWPPPSTPRDHVERPGISKPASGRHPGRRRSPTLSPARRHRA